MKAAYRSVPLRWLYPVIGAGVAATGAAFFSSLHAEPMYVAMAAIAIALALGWFAGTKGDTLRETAVTDPLTGVANRRCFDQRLGRALVEATRTGQPLTLLFVDVDQLKSLNDDLGHAAGDSALRLVGESMARTCRSRDLVARWGGDEFAVLAMWTTGREGLILAQRIRETLARLGLARGGCSPTVSIGVAEVAVGTADRPETLLLAADEALYQAKLSGRNRAVLAPATRARRRSRPAMAKLRTRPLRIPGEEIAAPADAAGAASSIGWPTGGRGERI